MRLGVQSGRQPSRPTPLSMVLSIRSGLPLRQCSRLLVEVSVHGELWPVMRPLLYEALALATRRPTVMVG
jgi:hypothetical protein